MIIRLLDLLKGALLLGAAEKGIRAKTVQIQRGILLDGNNKKCNGSSTAPVNGHLSNLTPS